jgi:hypothetical protein
MGADSQRRAQRVAARRVDDRRSVERVRYQVTEEIQAAPEAVWRVLVEVTDWPSWSPTMDRVRRLDGGQFGFDSAAEVRQPRLPRNVWRVTEFEPGRRFEWTTRSPGVQVRGDHLVEQIGEDASLLTLTVQTSGALSWLVDLCFSRMNRRYADLEASSLKRRCENASGS